MLSAKVYNPLPMAHAGMVFCDSLSFHNLLKPNTFLSDSMLFNPFSRSSQICVYKRMSQLFVSSNLIRLLPRHVKSYFTNTATAASIDNAFTSLTNKTAFLMQIVKRKFCGAPIDKNKRKNHATSN